MATVDNDAKATVIVRPLTPSDVPSFLELIQALAHYEKLPGPDAEARDRLGHDALADPPRFQVLLAERGNSVVGYAAYFFAYSTFLARPTLYVEDIFVLPERRGNGIGRAIMRELAREATRRGCGRMEWTVLDWNKPAMAFYETLGGKLLDDWRLVRLTADRFARLAESGGEPFGQF